MKGEGYVTEDGKNQLTIVRNNVIVCYRDGMKLSVNKVILILVELNSGTRIEFQQPLLTVYGSTQNRKPTATILWPIRNWKFRMRFDEEVWPRERDVDLLEIENFKVLRNLPNNYHFSQFGIGTEPRRVNDYRTLTDCQILSLPVDSSTSSPTLQLERAKTPAVMSVERKKHTQYSQSCMLNMRLIPIFKSRKPSEKPNNIFETREIGVGAAKEEEEREIQLEQRKKQVGLLQPSSLWLLYRVSG